MTGAERPGSGHSPRYDEPRDVPGRPSGHPPPAGRGSPVVTEAPAPVENTQRGPAAGRLIRAGITLVIVAAIVYAIVSNRHGVREALHSLAWTSVALSVVAAVAGSVIGMFAWRTLLAGEGHRISRVSAGQIFFVGQLGRYLPGSVWSVLLQMELGKRAGVPRARAFTASLVWVGLSLATGLAFGTLALPRLYHHHPLRFWVLLSALPVAVIAASPPVLNRLVNLLLRISRKAPLPRPLTWRSVGGASGWLLLSWLLYGVHLWLLARGIGAEGFGGFLRCAGGFALAVAAGVLFVVVPSGAGVREAVIVVALAGTMAAGPALGVAVVSRAVFVLSDVLVAGAAVLSVKLLARRAESAAPQVAAGRT